MDTILLLIKNQWREAGRAPMWQRNLIINIFLGLLILYFLAVFAALGFIADKAILHFYPDSDPIVIFNSFVLFYFLTDLVGRFVFDELPALSIRPLLHLPVSRKMMVHYILVRSKFSFFNLLPLLLFLPFAFTAVAPAHGWLSATGWAFSLMLMSMVNNYAGAYLKRMIAQNMKIIGAFILSIAALGALDYFNILKITSISSNIWGTVISYPALSLLFLALALIMYWVNYQLLYANTYLEEIHTAKKAIGGEMKAIGFLGRFGEIGQLMILELKLIMRSKRPRAIIIMGSFMLLYGGIFFPNPQYLDNDSPFLFFASIFTTGGFAITYGQYFFAWESAHFDGILTLRTDWRKYVTAKFLLTSIPIFVFYLLSLLYGVFIDVKLIAFLTAAMLYNIGVNIFFLLFLSTYNNKRLDVSQKASFNWQGVGATQFIAIIPVMAVPLGIAGLCYYFDMIYVGLAITGALGLAGILLHKPIIDMIVKRLAAQKYFMAAGYRKE